MVNTKSYDGQSDIHHGQAITASVPALNGDKKESVKRVYLFVCLFVYLLFNNTLALLTYL